MAEEAGGGGGPARQRRGGSPKDRAPAREREAEAWRAEVRGQLAALLEQVAERQQSFEESLRGWIGAELAERMQEVARARDDWEADRWENQNFIEHLAQRLKHVESSLSAASERRAIGPHPLAEMGRRLAPHGDASPPVRLLQESSRLVEARLTALEVSFGGLGGLGAVPEELQDLRSRVACLEERWARQPPPPAAARPSAGRRPPSSDPGRCSRRSEAACSARSGDNRSGAAQEEQEEEEKERGRARRSEEREPSGASARSAASAGSGAAGRLCRVDSGEPRPASARGDRREADGP